MDPPCNCCSKEQSTRICFSCDPSGAAPVNMCNACSERAHFGPMKYSHHVKSLVNMRLREKLIESHARWNDGETVHIGMCVKELEGCVNDLENQKRTDLEIMSATFEPLKNAVINRKRELTAQIIAHYDGLKPGLAATVSRCKELYKVIEKTREEIAQLKEEEDDEDFSLKEQAIRSQMTPFDPSSIKPMLPALGDGHRVKFPEEWNLKTVLNNILSCELKPTPTVITDEMVNNLTLTSGDVVDVFSNRMDKDGLFWVKICVSSEMSSPLYQLAFNCRQKLILGEIKRYSEHPHDLYTGMIVMCNHPEDGVWYRAIVADPCVKHTSNSGGMASVVIADTGYMVDVHLDRLAACSEEDLRMPFLAAPCSLYPGDHTPIGVDARWYYNDLIKGEKGKPRQLKAKFVHKKTAQYVAVPVWYVELSDAKGMNHTLNQAVEDARVQSLKSAIIVNKDIRYHSAEPSETVMNRKTGANFPDMTNVNASGDHKMITTSETDKAEKSLQITQIKRHAKKEPLPSHQNAAAPPEALRDGPPSREQMSSRPPPQLVDSGAEQQICNTSPPQNPCEHSSQPADPSPEQTAQSPPSQLIANICPERDINSTEVADANLKEHDLNLTKAQETAVEKSTTQSQPITSKHASDPHVTEDKTSGAVDDLATSSQQLDCESTSTPPPAGMTPMQGSQLFRPTPSVESGEAVTCEALETASVLDSTPNRSGESISTQNDTPSEAQSPGLTEPTADDSLVGNSAASKIGCFAEWQHQYSSFESRSEANSDKASVANSVKSDSALIKKTKRKSKKKSKQADFGVFENRDGRYDSRSSSSPQNGCKKDASSDESSKNRAVQISGKGAIRNWIKSPAKQVGCVPLLVGSSKPATAITKDQAVDFTSNGLSATSDQAAIDSNAAVIAPAEGSTSSAINHGERVHKSNSEHSLLPAAAPANEDEEIWQEYVPPLMAGPQPLQSSSATGFCAQNPAGVSDLKPREHRLFCILCKKSNQHRTEACPIAKAAYFDGGCPYCLVSSHSKNRCTARHQRINFNFLGERNYRRSHAKGNRSREANF